MSKISYLYHLQGSEEMEEEERGKCKRQITGKRPRECCLLDMTRILYSSVHSSCGYLHHIGPVTTSLCMGMGLDYE